MRNANCDLSLSRIRLGFFVFDIILIYLSCQILVDWAKNPVADQEMEHSVVGNSLCPSITPCIDGQVDCLRTTLVDSNLLNTSCNVIRSRNIFATEPDSIDEMNFPILHVRIVYRDYLFTEKLLAVDYQPQNHYCYFVDAKSDQQFKNRMKNLAECFPNVHVVSNISVQTSGFNMTAAFLSCFKLMEFYDWKYALILQQHDFVLRTNWELVEIFRMLGTSNHMYMAMETDVSYKLNPRISWTIASFQLLSKEICAKIFPDCYRRLQVIVGPVQSVLSRRFIDFIVKDINVSMLIEQLDLIPFNDEMFWGTIGYDPVLKAPSGFPRDCLAAGRNEARWTYALVRFVWWFAHENVTKNDENCKTRTWRHDVCVFGAEDVLKLLKLPHIVLNKIYPEFDATPAICLAKEIRRRRNLAPEAKENEFRAIKAQYEKLVEVRFARWIAAGNEEWRFPCHLM